MEPTSLQLPSAARFLPKGHSRTISRSPTRPRLMDDILSDLSPQTTLEAFTSASGTLKASIETASPTQRAFGIRAAIASKKIHQWVDELVSWPWPANACEGFKIPTAKRQKFSYGNHAEDVSGSLEETSRDDRSALDDSKYWGCLLAQDVIRYEVRVDEILEDMDDLDVEEIKRQILDTHILPKTRPSSGLDQQPVTLSVTSYTAMDDFTAIVTATVIQALPILSHLMGLMNVWSVRLAILRQVPLFTRAMDDAEIALRREWEKLRRYSSKRGVKDRVVSRSETPTLLRSEFETMRDSLQEKVGILGQQIDQMLDSLEGRQDTLPEAWLDRMEAIEKDYGEWTVRGERNVREGEWAKDAAQHLKKKELLVSTVAEDQSPITQNNPPLAEDYKRPIQNRLLVAQSPVQLAGNDSPDTESNARPVEMLPPTKSPQVENDLQPPTPTARQFQSSELTPPVQSQPVDVNGHTIAAKSQQGNGLSSLSRSSSTSEAEIKPRRSKPFQAGFSWYLTNGESGITPPIVPTKPIVEESTKPPKPSMCDGTEDMDQLAEEPSGHHFQDDPIRLKSTSKLSEVDAKRTTTAEQLLQIPVFPPLLKDEMLHGFISQDVLADLSSSTDGSFDEGSQTKASPLNETISSVDHNTATNSRESSSSSGRSKTGAIESHLKVVDSQPPKGGVITPPIPARIPRFGSGVANSLRQVVPLTILPAENNTSPHRSLDAGWAETIRINEADAPERSLSYTNRSVIVSPNDGRIPSKVGLSSTTMEPIVVNREIDNALQPASLLIPDSPLEIARAGPHPNEFRPHKLLKALSVEQTQPKLLSENESMLGSSLNTIQLGEYSVVTADRAIDFSETKNALIDDSSDKGSMDTIVTANHSLQCHLAPIKQVIDESDPVFSGSPSSNSTRIPTPSTSMVPVEAMSNDQNNILLTIKPSETRKLVEPVSLPTVSTDSNSAAMPAYLIAGNSAPTERLESYDPPTDIPHSTKPANNDLRVDKSIGQPGYQGPQAVLPGTMVSKPDSIESSSKPLVATSPHHKLHGPLDKDVVKYNDPVSITMSSADPSDPAIEVASKTSTPAVFSSFGFIPLVDELPEPIKAPSTPLTPVTLVSNPSISKSTSETLEAEHPEYSRPISPIEISHADYAETTDAITSTIPTFEAALVPSNNINSGVVKRPEGPQGVNSESQVSVARTALSPPDMNENSSLEHKEIGGESDDAATKKLSQSRKSSIASILVHRNDDLAGTPPENSFSSISPTIVASNNVTSTPITVMSTETNDESPNADRMSAASFLAYDEDSPSIRRMRLQDDYSPPESPLSKLHVPKYRLPQLDTSHSFESDSSYIDSPEPIAEAPLLPNVEVSPAPPPTNGTKTSDDQLQQQISEILESIPARIKLTSEPETTRMSRIPKLKKQTSRPSLNPQLYPLSRAPTPSFTLAPAYAKNPRPRPQNGNPEIKLYHLSRSTGDAPIKLFVRLVGEKGERVMVRVGGGWADLGEYLKEYASHHKRRSDREGKVEIQDLPPRVVSTGSSTSTIRNGGVNRSGRCSPVSRPASSLDRPISSLAVRKTRKSVGEDARERGYRSPSTPLSNSFRGSPSLPRALETPPSVSSRSVSRISWTEDESALGLAGPKSRKVEISAENAAWVESMKEKVRIASAEKEREKEKKPDFGEMDRVGTTKRLFKKGG